MLELHVWLNNIGFDNEKYSMINETTKLEEILLKDLELNEHRRIDTNNLSFAKWSWIRRVTTDSRMFIHINGEVHEITLGKCDGTNRDIKEGHNIEKMIISGEFDWYC